MKKRLRQNPRIPLLAKLLEPTLKEMRMNEGMKNQVGGEALIAALKIQRGDAQDQIAQMHAQLVVVRAEKKELEEELVEVKRQLKLLQPADAAGLQENLDLPPAATGTDTTEA